MNNQIRYNRTECTDPKKIQYYLNKLRTATIALSTNNQPYMFPISYVWMDQKVCFHGANSGRKMDMLTTSTNASVSILEEHGSTTSPVMAHTGVAYFSVYMEGELRIVDTLERSTEILQVMLDKFVPGYYDSNLLEKHVEKYRSKLDAHTKTFEFIPSFITAKEITGEYDLFYGGKTMRKDSKEKQSIETLIKSGLLG